MAQRREWAQHPGIADENVELAPALKNGGTQGVDPIVLIEVEGQERGRAPELADLVVDLLECASCAPHENEMCALARVSERNGAADTPCRSGDQGQSIGKARRVLHGAHC